MSRRSTRRSFCELGSASLITHLVGCGGDDPPAPTASDGSGDTAATDPLDDTGGASTSGASSTASSGVDSDATGSSGPDTEPSSTGTIDTTGEVLCEPSPGSIEGPFWRPGMPIRSDLDLYGDAGTPVRLRGRVVDGSCAPVVGAVVELWHASPIAPGAAPGEADATYDDGREFRYYGQVATDAEGRYAFDTLQPGWYLNGAEYRPSHLHVKVWTRDVERLTTQLYFDGDPFNAADPWFDPTMVLVLADDGTVERDFAI